MGLTIDNAEVLRLASQVAQITGETEIEAIRHALERQRALLGVDLEDRAARHEAFPEDYQSTVPGGVLPNREAQLRLLDQATERNRQRPAMPPAETPADRGWTRDDLYRQ